VAKARKSMPEKSMSLKYEPSSEPLHISVKQLFLNCELLQAETVAKFRKSMSGETRAELEAHRDRKDAANAAEGATVSAICVFIYIYLSIHTYIYNIYIYIKNK